MEFRGRQRSAHVSKSFLTKSSMTTSLDRRVDQKYFDYRDLIDSLREYRMS